MPDHANAAAVVDASSRFPYQPMEAGNDPYQT
jgi:hypothetical protein